ncbi:aldose 1-epimerase [Sphingomonas koreensis]|uniref:aldose 1-epimerase n=1 Tax=Sphingomonas koreensis TaxID=93064 RepID=UPI000A73DB03|nr:aldose 1-epimerase [Sphingomonas koreensis]PJI88604.1 aldose 1-epimerase [Sphingomonas koreensis]
MKLGGHGWELALLPETGGAIAALQHDGRDVLRRAPEGTADVLAAACFPLVPYANRIANGQFAAGGETYQLPLNFGDHPHSLHGFGWQSGWAVEDAGADHAVLVDAHDGSAGWPWAYRAEQRFALAPGAARIELSLTNLADTPMPVGLGLHPYFPCDADTRLRFEAETLWLADATMLPAETAPAAYFGDWAGGAAVRGDALIDNSYEGWDGLAQIEQRWGRIAIQGEGAGVLHLFRPPGADFFCAEPVSHLPDAINRGGMDALARGETSRLAMTLSVR